MSRRDDEGSVTPLIIGFALVLATLVAVVVDASAAYLRRQGLDNVADAAALAATDGLQGDQVYTHGLDRQARIDPVTAHAYVVQYLATSGAEQRYPGLRAQVVTDGRVVRVRLTAPLRLPLHVAHVGDRVEVTGDAASEVLVGE